MALKISDASVLIRTQIQAALQACAPERGITDWLDEIADDIGYARSSLRALYYGQATNAPKGGPVYALLAHPKLGRRFLNYLVQPVFPCAPASGTDLSAVIAQLEDAIDGLKAKQAPRVPLKGGRA